MNLVKLKPNLFHDMDWVLIIYCRRVKHFGFSHSNTINPDVDDTSYALRALYGQVANNLEVYGHAWKAGLEWLLSMQNDDGGWPAFEKNTDKKWPELIPIPEVKFVLTDPSTADLTGRTIEFLGSYTGMSYRDDQLRKAVQWLIKNQRSDGSWYGRWGIVYVYGTWAAVTGLLALGVDPQHKAVRKAVKWLLSIQNTDGGDIPVPREIPKLQQVCPLSLCEAGVLAAVNEIKP